MKSTLIVSNRGQITLPSSLRKKMGLKDGSVLTVEEQNGKLLLSPAVVMEVEIYSAEQIETWAVEDRLDPGTKEELSRKINKNNKL